MEGEPLAEISVAADGSLAMLDVRPELGGAQAARITPTADCARIRPQWRARFGCVDAPLVHLHRNGDHTIALSLRARTHAEVTARAKSSLGLSDNVVLFDADGRRTPTDFVPSDGVHLYAAPRFEVWMWPGVRRGHNRTIAIEGLNRPILMETLAVSPRLFRLRNVLTRGEADQLRQAADEQGWIASGSYDGTSTDSPQFTPSDGRRRSSTAWLGLDFGVRRGDVRTSATIERLQKRLVDAARIPGVGHAEAWQVVRYRQDDYQLHHSDLLRLPQYGSVRAVTTIVYLSTNPTKAGGGTNFPHAGRDDVDKERVFDASPFVAEPGDCTHGRTIQPRLGDALLFYTIESPSASTSRASSIKADARAAHAACRLHRGEKYIANVWLHTAPVNETKAVHMHCGLVASKAGEPVLGENEPGARGRHWAKCWRDVVERRNPRAMRQFVEVEGALHDATR